MSRSTRAVMTQRRAEAYPALCADAHVGVAQLLPVFGRAGRGGEMGRTQYLWDSISVIYPTTATGVNLRSAADLQDSSGVALPETCSTNVNCPLKSKEYGASR